MTESIREVLERRAKELQLERLAETNKQTAIILFPILVKVA